MAKRENLIDRTFSKLVVVNRAEDTARGRPQWRCLCECGNFTIVSSDNLRNGNIKSCGCWRKERLSQERKTHGMSKTAIYSIWAGIRKRCLDKKHPQFHRYGGRGIGICLRWRYSFENFLADMGERPSEHHSVERENNDGDYEPNNCKWATPKEQASNRRNNRKFLFQGEFLTVAEIARRIGIGRDTLTYRLNNGYTLEDAARVGRMNAKDKEPCHGLAEHE